MYKNLATNSKKCCTSTRPKMTKKIKNTVTCGQNINHSADKSVHYKNYNKPINPNTDIIQ